MTGFWQKVEKAGPDECWLWTAYTNSDGYGRVLVDGRVRGAHRVAYELVVGPIPEGLEIDHLCRNRACVNPSHMEPVTHTENARRGLSANGVKTHCPRGHQYSEANVYLTPKGWRMCRTCQSEKGGCGMPIDDQLRRVLNHHWNGKKGHQLGWDEAEVLAEAARAWLEFPTDAQVEAAARIFFDHLWDDSWDENTDDSELHEYRKVARAALEAAHNHTNRKDEP